jgi:hypothetical protein
MIGIWLKCEAIARRRPMTETSGYRRGDLAPGSAARARCCGNRPFTISHESRSEYAAHAAASRLGRHFPAGPLAFA